MTRRARRRLVFHAPGARSVISAPKAFCSNSPLAGAPLLRFSASPLLRPALPPVDICSFHGLAIPTLITAVNSRLKSPSSSQSTAALNSYLPPYRLLPVIYVIGVDLRCAGRGEREIRGDLSAVRVASRRAGRRTFTRLGPDALA